MSCAYPSETAYWEEMGNFDRGMWTLCWLIEWGLKIVTIPLWGPIWLLGYVANKLGIRL